MTYIAPVNVKSDESPPGREMDKHENLKRKATGGGGDRVAAKAEVAPASERADDGMITL